MKPPIFILGVPRSGTTLLRTILNCHAHIACGPEAPWLAHQDKGILALQDALTTGEHSYCRNFQVPATAVRQRIRALVEGLFNDFAAQQGKIRWAHKTPDDSMVPGFFTDLFPEAKFVHLVRHPLDVALSTTKVAAHRAGVSAWHEQNLVLEPGFAVKNTLFNSVLRWRRWNEKISASLAGRDHLRVSYEDMVQSPRETFAAIFDFLGEPFDARILDYRNFSTIFPEWEWGSADVRRASSVNTNSVGRWRRECSPEEAFLLASVAGKAAALVPDLAKLDDERLSRLFAENLRALATDLGLPPPDDASHAHSEAWLWFNGLSSLDWPHTRLTSWQGGFSPLPWLCALLGARTTLVDATPPPPGAWENLRQQLRVEVDWKVTEGGAAPVSPESTLLYLHGTGPASAPAQLPQWEQTAAALRPGQTLALSFAAADEGAATAVEQRLIAAARGGLAPIRTSAASANRPPAALLLQKSAAPRPTGSS